MEFSSFIENSEKIATILAIIGGGVWAYFNFFKGHVYHLRLEPAISGKVFQQKGTFYLLATAKVKNVGLSQVTIEERGTGLRVLAFNSECANEE